MEIQDAKRCRGVWLPKNEEFMVEMIDQNPKKYRMKWRDGKGTYQIHKLDAAMRFVNQHRVCIDIGAHVGTWSMHLIKLFDFVEAFEPVDIHTRLFPYNVEGDNYRLHKIALGNCQKSVSMKVAPTNSGTAYIDGVGDIPMVPLDDFEFKNVDFIKVDVEGYELDVVMGAEQTICRCRPIMVVEQKGKDQVFYGQDRDAAVHWLHSELGMRIIDLVSGDFTMGW